MKKILLAVLVMLLAAACTPSEKIALKSQKVVRNDIEMLHGETSLDQLYFDYPQWREEMEAYKPDSALIKKLSALDKQFDLLLFFSTWCPDSKREVSRFFRIAGQAGLFPKMNMRMWALDRKLQVDNNLAQKYNIKRVPTFIFMVKGKEIGRIIESPESFLLEEDVFNILSKIK